MAGGPGPIKAHVPGIYRFTATALGASMWFFVGGNRSKGMITRANYIVQLMYRARKDGPVLMGWKHPWDH
ncbi:hypothetical protein F5Y01DRAFT_311392 [Xylaria sp. FL0043]|nr:hypothetical protein F5Y01DRAFT_311392 [Xylaria sp. FL0043]